MKIVHSEKHALHAPRYEICGGVTEPCFEKPARAQEVLAAIKKCGFGEIVQPDSHPLDKVLRVHDPRYVAFLQTAFAEWQAAGNEGDAFAHAYNVQHSGGRVPGHVNGKMGYYTGDGTVALTAGSWEALLSSVDTALTAQAFVSNGAGSAFALCRPPGHHATAAVASGYCYLNNAAIAAQAFIDDGAKRVAVLDVDYHHGNGTQEIFYDRDDVFFTSLHADPSFEYPYFRGYADETGRGRGEGYTVNYPLAAGTAWDAYDAALQDAQARILAYRPDILLVSLGVDTYKKDPISQFLLDSDDYIKMGARIAALGLPTLFVLEGGYAIGEIGLNVTNALSGFLDKFGR